ncbi:DUF1801 domain-containing protein [Marivita sp.]|uniref:DUF1801 domain-containing protein n=1 Tax=Marivita sp. TaxID=2003365 RepID=UPI003F6D7BF6
MSLVPPFPNHISAVFEAYPDQARNVLYDLREMVFGIASSIPEAGPVMETLKWGQPSYAVTTGTPVRLGVSKAGEPAVFVHCQTRVISDARALFDQGLCFEGNRAISFPSGCPIPETAVRHVLYTALSYRLKA